MAEPLNGVNERHTFVVKVSDKPGTLELIGATFAHRGVSLAATVGSDGSLGPDGHATITLHFSASERRKDVLRATLSRLNRVVSVHEIAPELVQAVALVRVAPDAGLPLTNAAVFPLPAPGRETGVPAYRHPRSRRIGRFTLGARRANCAPCRMASWRRTDSDGQSTASGMRLRRGVPAGRGLSCCRWLAGLPTTCFAASPNDYRPALLASQRDTPPKAHTGGSGLPRKQYTAPNTVGTIRADVRFIFTTV